MKKILIALASIAILGSTTLAAAAHHSCKKYIFYYESYQGSAKVAYIGVIPYTGTHFPTQTLTAGNASSQPLTISKNSTYYVTIYNIGDKSGYPTSQSIYDTNGMLIEQSFTANKMPQQRLDLQKLPSGICKLGIRSNF